MAAAGPRAFPGGRLLWVIPGDVGEPVAFLMGSQIDGCLHVEQLSVDPGSARRGLGRMLLEHAARRAARRLPR